MENNCAASVFCFASSESQNFFPFCATFDELFLEFGALLHTIPTYICIIIKL